MYQNGQVVILRQDKTHGDNPETMLAIKAGICGMVVSANRSPGTDHQYVVDFGPEGQWNCVHRELNGHDDEEGYEPPEEESRGEVARTNDAREEESEERTSWTFDDPSDEDPSESSSPPPPIPVPSDDEKIPVIVNPEADIQKRMKELEKGN